MSTFSEASEIYNYDFYAISTDKCEKKIFHRLIFEHYLILSVECQEKDDFHIFYKEHLSISD